MIPPTHSPSVSTVRRIDVARVPGSIRVQPKSSFPMSEATHKMSNPNQERWSRVKERLRVIVGENVFSSWFARMELESSEGDTIKLSVPTRFLKSWMQSHYAEKLLECWQSEQPAVGRIELTVRSAVIRTLPPKVKPAEPQPIRTDFRDHRGFGAELRSLSTPVSDAHDALGGSPLDPRLTFDSFVVGRSNTLAHAAAKQVAQARARRCRDVQPALHPRRRRARQDAPPAIARLGRQCGNRAQGALSHRRALHVRLRAALRTQNALAFKETLRAIDVLVIDDLQFLQGKSTQAEFCHTLNALIDAGRQVVIAADRPPSDLESLDERVRSRLAGGLVVEMGVLGEELRLEILKARVAAARHHHPGFDVPPPVLAFIAKIVTHNGRDLEGALNRLLANSKLTGQPITLEMAEREVRDLIRPQEPRRVKIEEIQRVVARQYNVSRADLLSSRRTANVVRPRQVAMYLAKTLTLRSLPEIGRRFGGRDHTTVLHAVRKIENLVDNDNSLAEEIEILKRQLQE